LPSPHPIRLQEQEARRPARSHLNPSPRRSGPTPLASRPRQRLRRAIRFLAPAAAAAAGGEMNWGLAAAVASAAAVAAASGAELLACDCDGPAPPAVGRCDGLLLSRQQHHDDEGPASLASREKPSGGGGNRFAPRFDGLRFIETLVTAHR
ncbi:unnamed protein product, partial [Urochloa humidicola]